MVIGGRWPSTACSASSPRQTVPGTGCCMALPSGSSGASAYGLYFF